MSVWKSHVRLERILEVVSTIVPSVPLGSSATLRAQRCGPVLLVHFPLLAAVFVKAALLVATAHTLMMMPYTLVYPELTV